MPRSLIFYKVNIIYIKAGKVTCKRFTSWKDALDYADKFGIIDFVLKAQAIYGEKNNI